MISLKIIDWKNDHFLITTDEPARFEVSLIEGKRMIIMHGYVGEAGDMEQEPIITYDGSMRDEMEDIIK